MMMSEFVERTGFEPTPEEYAEIEQQYCESSDNKDVFCARWKKTVGAEGMMKTRAVRIESLRSRAIDAQKALKNTIAEKEKRISELERELEREQEWRPCEDSDNVSQADYDKLAKAAGVRELSDDEAAELIAQEFGFERSRIRIVREADVMQINRHRRLRKAGTVERKPLYYATDWDYVRFSASLASP